MAVTGNKGGNDWLILCFPGYEIIQEAEVGEQCLYKDAGE